MRKASRPALWLFATMFSVAVPAWAQSYHHGGNYGGGNNGGSYNGGGNYHGGYNAGGHYGGGDQTNRVPQDPYHYDNYNRVPGVNDVTTTSQTTNNAGQPITSTTTTYDRDQFGTTVRNSTLNANGTRSTYNQEIDYAQQPAPLAYGTTTRQLPVNPNTNTGGYAPNAQFATTTNQSAGTGTQPVPYYDTNASQNGAANPNATRSGGYGPVNPATSADVTNGFTSHASYNGQ